MQFNQHLENVQVYEAGKPVELVVREFGIQPQQVIKLASNENPHGCSPVVNQGIQAILSKQIPLYPDDSYHELKENLSHHFGIGREQVIIGCGSDQIIHFCIQAKAELKKNLSKMLISGLTFPMYEICANIHGVQTTKTPSQQHRFQEFQDLYQKHKPDIVFLCVPNNPLGECLDKQEVYDLIQTYNQDTLVVVDGAYQEYAKFKDQNKWIQPKDLLEEFDHVIYLGTFSKAYGLGGLRVGYGLANESIIKTLHKLRPPFNITSLSLQAAQLALQDQDFVESSVADNFQQMTRYETFFKQKKIEYIESYTNFITATLPDTVNSTEIAQALLQKGIIIRNFPAFNAFRITIGTASQNDQVLQILEQIL